MEQILLDSICVATIPDVVEEQAIDMKAFRDHLAPVPVMPRPDRIGEVRSCWHVDRLAGFVLESHQFRQNECLAASRRAR